MQTEFQFQMQLKGVEQSQIDDRREKIEKNLKTIELVNSLLNSLK